MSRRRWSRQLLQSLGFRTLIPVPWCLWRRQRVRVGGSWLEKFGQLSRTWNYFLVAVSPCFGHGGYGGYDLIFQLLSRHFFFRPGGCWDWSDRTARAMGSFGACSISGIHLEFGVGAGLHRAPGTKYPLNLNLWILGWGAWQSWSCHNIWDKTFAFLFRDVACTNLGFPKQLFSRTLPVPQERPCKVGMAGCHHCWPHVVD